MREKMEERNIRQLVARYVLTVPNENFAGLTVSKLAYHLDIERSKLSRCFKDEAGMTLDTFIKKEKMFRAAFMLVVYSDLSVKEISREIGYCTCDYFVRVFRDYYGIAPEDFKELRTIHNSENFQHSRKYSKNDENRKFR